MFITVAPLKHVISHSCCAREGQKETHLTWSVRPHHAKVYYVKCHRRHLINSTDRQHIYTLRMDNGEIWSGGTLDGRISHRWEPEDGMFSLVIADPIEEDGNMWYNCDFTGNGKHTKHTNYVCLNWKNKGILVLWYSHPTSRCFLAPQT